MGRFISGRMSLPIIAAILLWIKTYIVYKVSFNITIENVMQEIILLINPLGFLLFIFGLAYFIREEKRRNRYVLIVSGILGGILYANVAFYRFFTDFLTLPLLFQTSNFTDLGKSAVTEIHMIDMVYFLDILLLFLLIRYKPAFVSFAALNTLTRHAYFLMAAAVFCLNMGLSEAERPQLLTRTFDRDMLVKNLGTYNYHLYDLFLQSKTSAQRAFADSSKLEDIDTHVQTGYAKPDPSTFGLAEGRNVIVITLESVQNFVIGNDVYGEEITPFLNELIHDSLYFDEFYHQTGQGKTSDSEFLIENSLYPLSRGAVFFTHPRNEYSTMAEKLGKEGYYTAAMHANNKSFWNRDVMYDAIGYDYFYSADEYDITQRISVGWGMKDIPFFEQSVEKMKKMPAPFYTKLITLTNHHPFKLEEEDKFISEFDSNSGTLNRYFQTVRYTDEAVKEFMHSLKASGLYEDAIIILYGDHYGISENHNEGMAQYLKKDLTPYDHAQLQRVPLIIHIPGVTDQEGRGQTISKVGGQIDLRPTIMHLLGKETKNDIQFGQDLLSPYHREMAIFRDGRFVTKDYLYADHVCYSKKTEEPVDVKVCDPAKEDTREELALSDRIIYGDLMRFYKSQ